MTTETDRKLCDEYRKNIWAAIVDIKEDNKNIRNKLSFFNVTSVGILVAIITGLIVNHFGG